MLTAFNLVVWTNYEEYFSADPVILSHTKVLRILFLSNQLSTKLPAGDRCTFMYGTLDHYNTSDVVIIQERIFSRPLPSYRPPGQRWVFRGWEAAYRNFDTTRKYRNMKAAREFNYTMTYSVHSDFYLPYGKCKKVVSNPETVTEQIDKIVKSKTKLVAWFASDCMTVSMRENYIRQLMNHIQVDVYGGCGNISCPKDTCETDTILQKYKFYIAFENTLNGEYITEKVWRSFTNGLVPIVYGALDTYSMILPKGSYIDVSDFTSPQELATYMFKVNSDETLFRSFFNWKYNYECNKVVVKQQIPAICDFLISAGPKMVDVTEVWDHPSTRSDNASHYLKKLGVLDITPREFNLRT